MQQKKNMTFAGSGSWEVKLAGNWRPFAAKEDQVITANYERGIRSFCLKERGQEYNIDFDRMTQKNLTTAPNKVKYCRWHVKFEFDATTLSSSTDRSAPSAT